jgi:hypothetical protein
VNSVEKRLSRQLHTSSILTPSQRELGFKLHQGAFNGDVHILIEDDVMANLPSDCTAKDIQLRARHIEDYIRR